MGSGFKVYILEVGQKSNLFDAECVSLSPAVPIEITFTLDTYIHLYANFHAVTYTAALPLACRVNGLGNVIEEPPSE
jgi:hypothetical protein